MSWKCKDCGNTDLFEIGAIVEEWTLCNADGEFLDEIAAYDTGNCVRTLCHECSSENVEDVEEEDNER